MTMGVAPPPPDRKAVLLAELRKRAGDDPRKTALVDELGKRYGAAPAFVNPELDLADKGVNVPPPPGAMQSTTADPSRHGESTADMDAALDKADVFGRAAAPIKGWFQRSRDEAAKTKRYEDAQARIAMNDAPIVETMPADIADRMNLPVTRHPITREPIGPQSVRPPAPPDPETDPHGGQFNSVPGQGFVSQAMTNVGEYPQAVMAIPSAPFDAAGVVVPQINEGMEAANEALIRPIGRTAGRLAQGAVDQFTPAVDASEPMGLDIGKPPEERGIGPAVGGAAELAAQLAAFHYGGKIVGGAKRALTPREPVPYSRRFLRDRPAPVAGPAPEAPRPRPPRAAPVRATVTPAEAPKPVVGTPRPLDPDAPISAERLAALGDRAWEGADVPPAAPAEAAPVLESPRAAPATEPSKPPVEVPRPAFRRGERGAAGDVPGGVSGDRASATTAKGATELTGMGKGIWKFGRGSVSRTKNVIRRLGGEHGEELVRRLEAVESDVKSRTGAWKQDWHDALHKIPLGERAAFDKNLRAIVEDRMPAKSEAQARAVQTLRRVAREVAQFANESGVRITDGDVIRKIGEDWDQFFPQKLKPEYAEGLATNDPAILKKFMDDNVGEGKAFKDKGEASEALKTYRQRRLKSFHPGTEMPRKIHWPDEWVEPSGIQTFDAYIERAAQNAAEHRHFKYRDAETGALRGAEGQGDLGDLLAKIQESGGDVETVRKLTLRILKRHPETMGETGRAWRTANTLEGAWTGARLLGGSLSNAIEQASQSANTWIVGGTKATGAGFGRFAKHPLKSSREAIRQGSRRPISEYTVQTGFEDSPIGHLAQRTSKGINRLSALQAGSDAAFRTVAHEAAKTVAKEMQKQLSGGRTDWLSKRMGKDPATAERLLRKMEMAPEEIQRMRDGTATPEDLVNFGQRFVKATNLESTPANRMALATNPKAQFVFRMKNFTYSQAAFYKDFVFDEAMHGNVKPLARALVATAVIGEGIGAAKDLVTGPSRSRPSVEQILDEKDGKRREMLERRLVDDLSNVAFFGIIGKGVAAVAGDWVAPSGRNQSKDFAKGLLYPPLADTGEDFLAFFGDVPGDGTWKAFQKFVKNQASGPRGFYRAYQSQTDEGIGDIMRETRQHGGMPTKRRSEYFERLRARRGPIETGVEK